MLRAQMMERPHGNGTVTVSQNLTETTEVREIVLTTPETDPSPRVRWAAETVDNEFMGKYKSKCCCIYKKPKKWNDDSDDDSDSDCETGHCRGHVEKRHPKDEADGGGPGPSCPT